MVAIAGEVVLHQSGARVDVSVQGYALGESGC